VGFTSTAGLPMRDRGGQSAHLDAHFGVAETMQSTDAGVIACPPYLESGLLETQRNDADET